MRKYQPILIKEIDMNSIADGSVIIQTTSRSVPSTPPWFGEVALIVQHLRRQGILEAICERVRFARRRFGHYEVIDFVAVLFGYAISGERTRGAPSTSACILLPQPSWRSSDESACPRARRSVAFLPVSPSHLSKPCARSFSKICSRVP